MLRSPCLNRIVRTLLISPALAALASCGSSGTTATAPTSITRCGVTVSVSELQVPSQGGAGTVTVTTARECAWTASVEGQWLAIRTGGNGQGDGSVEFAATANGDPVTRRGAVVVNAQRAEITQAAAPCEISLMTPAGTFGQSGGSGQIDVRASSSMCQWTASANVDWVTVRRTSGQGSAQIPFDVQPTSGPPRTGTVVVAGQQFSVTQAEGCAYAISPAAHNATPAGGTSAMAITTAAACPWTASSNAPWITFGQSSGAGPASLPFTVAAWDGPSRTGTAVVAGQTFTVTQSAGCTYTVQPLAHSVGAGGGNVSVAVTANEGCSWSASADVEWIVVQGVAGGTGNGAITLNVAATTGPARTGTVTVAGQRVTITQGAGCVFSISPTNASIASTGGSGKVTVTAGAGCAWTASSGASWLSITAGATGSGNGEVQFTAAATTGPARNGTMTIAGRAFTVNQGQGCAYTLSSAATKVDDDGGSGSFTVQTAAGCGWSATSAVPWITITSPTNVTGEGTVRFNVTANTGPSRSGAISVAEQTFTVTQGNGCTYALSAAGQNVPAVGGTGTVNVTSATGCAWSSTSNASWLSITTPPNGTGNGSVGFSAAAHTGPPRTGTLTIAGRTFTVSQSEGCTFSISPEQTTVDAAGGSSTVSVTAPDGCAWTASSSTAWIRVSGGATGSGNGSVQLSIEAQTGPARSGTATIAGRTFTVNQSDACTFAISPDQVTVDAAGGGANVTVTAPAGCNWTSSGNAPWITISSNPAGSGNGTVTVAVEANAGAARSGTATIAGRTLTVSQGSGCTYSIAPTSHNAASGISSVAVTITAPSASCAWTASSSAAWLTIAGAAAGSGNGVVQVDVAANSGPARTGTALIAGQTLTVNQDTGCTISLSATAQPIQVGGGPGSVNVIAVAECAWTAVSQVPWIAVTGGASGAGDGAVQFSVEPNGTGAARSGTILIGAVTFTVNQS